MGARYILPLRMFIITPQVGAILRVIVLVLLTLILSAAFMVIWGQARTLRHTPFLLLNGHSVQIEIFDTPELRTRGLSGRSHLQPDTGALFTYEKPDFHGIWMKEMRFAIDVLWLDSTGKIIHMVDDMQPESYPQAEPARYILELPASAIGSYELTLGDLVDNLPALR
jgi:uncharacterized membrane protein (UPF0127 family)